MSSQRDAEKADIERETQDNIDRGMSTQEARYAALRKFGNVALVRENTRAVWIPVWLDQFRQDVDYALRTMRRAPGFAAIAVGSSALGIGSCAVIFAMLNFARERSATSCRTRIFATFARRDRLTGSRPITLYCRHPSGCTVIPSGIGESWQPQITSRW